MTDDDRPIMTFGKGEAWWWTSDDNGIPDHPPVHLGTVTIDGLTPDETPTGPEKEPPHG
ncbi:hypothetical protein [Actinomadura litoris]|uniref:Uncharacterized protein n=1 Tax=Actinomadura litoris TaxID=2678616 RepID=A0A7K1LAG5_9ACTN|nr:hypothetical protein [Actinomadura litoris]MUN41427.1 hypothetical protein [Actinomadura litoris]